ncbi:TonB-dependent receptor [Sphingomonas sp. VNH70]|uniref:TonB-dependent receptor n=1 Tax=Sphingomonas silueang TaxID=3156617 RepID=UPI0032B457F5
MIGFARSCLLGTSAAACLLMAGGEASAQTRRFDVAAQPARSGIPLFAHQAGIQILVSAALADKVQVNRVQGSHDVDAALRMLLAGTGLEAVRAQGAFIVRRHQRIAQAAAMPAAVRQPDAVAQEAPPQPPAAAPVEEPAEDIVVTGIRASLQQSLQAKRAAGNIVDVITAQDIGRLPDQNVAESMSRITGVQITRSQGEGSNFTVRGISQNRLEINGRTFLGPAAGGNASLESLSPEVISSIVVAKSPSADMPEGALGATVNLKTKRPLDLKGLVVSGRAQGIYTDQADKLGYRGSALVSAPLTDTLGVLGTVAYNRIDTRGYTFDTGGWTRTNNIDANGDGVRDPGLVRPNRLQAKIEQREQKRLTFNGALQYRPTDRWNIVLDATYTKLDEDRTPIHTQILLNDNVTGATVSEQGTVTGGTYSGVTVRPLIYNAPSSLESTNVGFSTSYRGPVVEVSTDASYSKGSSSPAAGSSLTYIMVQRAGNVANAATDFNAGRNVPRVDLTGNFDTQDINRYRLTALFDGAILIDNEGYDGRVDFKIHTNFGPLSSIELGSRFEHLSFYSEAPQNVPSAASVLSRADRNGDGILTVDELPGVAYSGTAPFFPGVATGSLGGVLNGFVDPVAVRSALGLPTPAADTIALGRVSIKNVQQDTLALYAKANVDTSIGTMPFNGNVGVRYLSQERLSSGFLSDTQSASLKPTFDFWLPSANAALLITDELTFRVAAAKVVARPGLNDVGISFIPLLVSRTGNRGNPNLRPFEATQYDASLEWYFAPSSAITAAAFYKNVDSFTINVTQEEFVPGLSETYGTFQITQPVNGSAGKIKGFELSYQQSLRFLPGLLRNLGVQANYTFVDSSTPLIDEATSRALALPGLSKHSYNLIGFYEDDTVSLRAAYVYRNGYLVGQGSAAAGGSSYADGRGQLDVSAQINLTKNWRLLLEALNVTKSVERQYLQESERLLFSTREDRRIFFGIAATF